MPRETESVQKENLVQKFKNKMGGMGKFDLPRKDYGKRLSDEKAINDIIKKRTDNYNRYKYKVDNPINPDSAAEHMRLRQGAIKGFDIPNPRPKKMPMNFDLGSSILSKEDKADRRKGKYVGPKWDD